MKTEEGKSPEKKTGQFTKAQLLGSSRYSPSQKDMLRVLLMDGQTYSHEQAQSIIKQFLKKEVR